MKHFAALTLFLIGVSGMSQSLIPNGNFETYSACPSWVGQINYAPPHQLLASHTGSADYINTCATSSMVTAPTNAFGSQAPFSGNGYIGFALFYISTPSFREYVCTPLSTPMTVGSTYTISFYASMGDNSSHTTDDLQFYFSNACPIGPGGWPPLTSLTPQAALSSGTLINNKSSWVNYTTTVTATSAWTYVTMGNFLSDAATTMTYHSAGSYNTGYIYMEDYTVTLASVLSADIDGPVAEEREGIELLWGTSREDETHEWQIERSIGDAAHFEVLGTMPAQGNSSQSKSYRWVDLHAAKGLTNYYRLKLVNNDGSSGYSQAVAITPEQGSEWFHFESPNPILVGEDLHARVTTAGESEIRVSILSMEGKELKAWHQPCLDGINEVSANTTGIAPGYYLMRIVCGDHSETTKFLLLNQ